MNWLPHAFIGEKLAPTVCRTCPLEEGASVHIRPANAEEAMLRGLQTYSPLQSDKPIAELTPEFSEVAGFVAGMAVASLLFVLTGGPNP